MFLSESPYQVIPQCTCLCLLKASSLCKNKFLDYLKKEPINWLIDWQIQKKFNPEVCEGRMVNVHFIL